MTEKKKRADYIQKLKKRAEEKPNIRRVIVESKEDK